LISNNFIRKQATLSQTRRRKMISREPINPNRVRKITGSFSWLDHRLLHDGHLQAMSPEEMLLYFFLVLVGDRQGMSFYHYDKICAFLKMELDAMISARTRLVQKALIAFDGRRYQVLQLPRNQAPPPQKPAPGRRTPPPGEFLTLAQILNTLATDQA